MKVCTDKFAEPRYEALDWCVDAGFGTDSLIQLFVELILCFVLFYSSLRLFRWRKRKKGRKEHLNTGNDKGKAWPPH